VAVITTTIAAAVFWLEGRMAAIQTSTVSAAAAQEVVLVLRAFAPAVTSFAQLR